MMRTIFTERDYRERLERIHDVMRKEKLSLRSAIKFLARTPPRTSEVSLWRAWKRYGEPSITETTQ
jgi:hypothetical protein